MKRNSSYLKMVLWGVLIMSLQIVLRHVPGIKVSIADFAVGIGAAFVLWGFFNLAWFKAIK